MKKIIEIYVDDLRRLHSHKIPRLSPKPGHNYYETAEETLIRCINVLEKEEKDNAKKV